MTFAQARLKHLCRLDDALVRLRRLAEDADVMNPEWKEFELARERIEASLRAICELNRAESQAN